jgi:GNAT superfamily N-acetyltransferase
MAMQGSWIIPGQLVVIPFVFCRLSVCLCNRCGQGNMTTWSVGVSWTALHPCTHARPEMAVGRVCREVLAGMATTAPYHASLYGFNLAVAPKHRGIGYGRRLMHETQAYALSQGLNRVSATVDACRPRLLAYYVALGAEIVNTGVSRSTPPPPLSRCDALYC